MDDARIYAETVIRQRKEAISVRRFGVKMQALSSKIEGAARTQQMSTTLKDTIPALKSAMKKMDAAGISGSVGEFEKVFEDMDVKTAEMDAAMESMYGGSIDSGEVNNLLGEIQSENAMAAGG